ncbi:AAA family ATPase [Microbacterium foliorum]
MELDTEIIIYDGPLSWFHEQTRPHEPESFYMLISAADRDTSTIRVRRSDDDEEEDPEYVHVAEVAAEATDFASLGVHAITNFVGIVRRLRPGRLHLHNPPLQVRDQLLRVAPETEIVSHDYPGFTRTALSRFDSEFSDRLVGQSAAKERLLAALYTLSDPHRTQPVVVMLYGPSGVGKTETAVFLSELAGGELLRKQFSMYQSDKFASYLFGGSHNESSLAQDLLHRETNVVLIDEFDKAHPTFYSAFYDLFDTGAFEDKNYSVQVGATLIICTSNFASEDEVRRALGDPLSSRFDFVIPYEELTPDEVTQVVGRIVDQRFARLSIEEAAVLDRTFIDERVTKLSQNPGNVRRLRKVIDELFATLLVREFIAGRLGAPKTRRSQRPRPEPASDAE